MKKHTQLAILIGILFCNISISIASDGQNNGPYSPAPVIAKASNILFNIIGNIISNFAYQSIINKTKQDKIPQEQSIYQKTKHTKISYEILKRKKELHKNPLPKDIAHILNQDEENYKSQPLCITNESGIDNTILAQQISLHKEKDLHIIDHENLKITLHELKKLHGLNFYDKSKIISSKIKQIVHESAHPIIYLALDDINLDDNVNDPMTKNFEFYQRTWGHLLEEITNQYNNDITIIMIPCPKPSSNESQSPEQKNGAYVQSGKLLQINCNPKSNSKKYTNTHSVSIDKNIDILTQNQIKQLNKPTLNIDTSGNQLKTNSKLTHTWHVTQAMHDQAASDFHEKNQSSFIAKYIYPLLWTQYTTPLITYQKDEGSEFEKDEIKNLTQPELSQAIKVALHKQIDQLKNMTEREQKENSAYTIDKSQRTCSIKQPGQDDQNKPLSYTYGAMSSKHISTAIKNIKNNQIRNDRKKNFKNQSNVDTYIFEYVRDNEPDASKERKIQLQKALTQYAYAGNYDEESQAHLPLKMKEIFAKELSCPQDLAGLARVALITHDFVMNYQGTLIQDGKINLEQERKNKADAFKAAITRDKSILQKYKSEAASEMKLITQEIKNEKQQTKTK